MVGIGTTVPTEFLDVYGNAKVSNQIIAKYLSINGIGTFTALTDGTATITSGIITSSTGIVTYYGDGGKLINLPTSQWVDVDSGFGYTSIYAAGNVGVATVYPYYTFQVGGNPNTNYGVGFNSTGDINATGIITASQLFISQINVSGVATFQSSAYFGDNDVVYFGDDADLQIFYNSTSNSGIISASNNLALTASNNISVTGRNYYRYAR